jgi:hypothetical protein
MFKAKTMPAADVSDKHFATLKIAARVSRMLANTPYYTPLSAVQEYWVDRALVLSRGTHFGRR